MNTRRIVVLFTTLLLTLGIGSGLANASENLRSIEVPVGVTMIADSVPTAPVTEVPVSPAQSPGVVGPATSEDAAGAIQSSVGEVIIKTIKQCGLGALVGDTTGELTLQNVIVFVTATGKRLAAIAGGPLAVITIAAQGCIERVTKSFGGGSAGSLGDTGSAGSLAG